jgi:hypothetical protein
MRRAEVHPYFCANGLKKSLAEPDDFFHHDCAEAAALWRVVPRLGSTGGRPAAPKPARLTDRDECTCDRAAVAYTRSAL